jgi:NAD(P)-dependent dehydrogenase (short-subunit alcohol dehydrogenase family)
LLGRCLSGSDGFTTKLVEVLLDVSGGSEVARERGGVIVVGGAGQIGSAVVTHYLEGGIAVAVVDKKPAEMNPALGRGAQLHKIIADVTRTEDLSRASSDLARLEWVPRHIVSLAGGALDQEFNCLIDTDETTIRNRSNSI